MQRRHHQGKGVIFDFIGSFFNKTGRCIKITCLFLFILPKSYNTP